MKKWLLAVITAALLAAVGMTPGSASAEIKLGILPRLGHVEMFGMFSPLAEYLTRETGEKVSIVIPKDFEAFKSAVKAGHIDLGFANPLIYVQVKEELSLEPLALAAEIKAGTKFRGIIIVRKDNGGMKKLQDLKGKKLVFVDKDSAAGYIFQMLLLRKSGFDIHKDFTIVPFAKKHGNVVQAVFNRAADGGGLREDDLEKMKDRVDLSQIRIIGYTDYYPNWPMFATGTLSKEMTAKIQSALLKLNPNHAMSAKVLQPAGLKGFAPVSDADYEQLRQAARLVGALQ